MTGDRIPFPPKGPDALQGFPEQLLAAGTEVWRVHGEKYGPWFFGQTYRFSLKERRGTCHVALQPNTAILETVIRGSRAIELDDLVVRRIRRLQLPHDYLVADLMSMGATAWGITRQFSTDFPYDRCQRWAQAFGDVGFGGLQFWANHDVTPDGVALGIFGKNGERKRWARGRAQRLDRSEWISVIEDDLGVAVLNRPHSSTLTFVTF